MSKDTIAAIYPLSPLQQGLLFECLYANDNSLYFEQQCLTLEGELQPAAFQRAWQELVSRHPALRTLILWENRKAPLQVVRRTALLPWRDEDWRGLTSAEQDTRLERFLEADRQQGFVLTQAPLMRCALIRVADSTHHFVWSAHHIVVDGWCTSILYGEAFALYRAQQQGQTLHLPVVRPYQDYIAWLQQQDQAAAEHFWRRELQGFTAATPLPTDRQPQATADDRPASHTCDLPEHLQTTIPGFCRRQHLTPNTMFMGAWALLLNRYSREEDLVFGVTVAGRPGTLPGADQMVGLFINTLPVRVQVIAGTPVVAWLQQLQAAHVRRDEYAYSALSDIRKWSDVAAGNRLFESLYAFENYPAEADDDTPLQLRRLRIFEHTSFALSLAVMPGETYSFILYYKPDRFSPATIARMAGHYQQLLHNMVAAPTDTLGALTLLTDAERQQVLVQWNQTHTIDPQDRGLHQRVEAQAALTPDQLAVACGTRHLSYRQLNAQANRLAHYLRDQGVKAETLVGICVGRCVEMVVGLLAILKAGGAYVPMDPAYPAERLQFMVADSGIALMLTQTALLSCFADSSAPPFCLDDSAATLESYPDTNLNLPLDPQQLAYLIYTSGSTGKPKGVMVEHRNVANLIAWHQRAFAITPQDRATQLAGFAFDACGWEIWPYLTCGASLHLLDSPQELITPIDLQEWFIRQRITVSFVPTPLVEPLLQLAWDHQPVPLRWLLTGGDKLQHYPDRALPFHLVNNYGPTENTVVTTSMVVPPQHEAGPWPASPPIGYPLDNVQVFILDQYLAPVPIGVSGELYVGGKSLARGYWNRPELTADRFILNPFGDGLLYQTGDLVRWLPDGAIAFIGRLDHQVKIRGYRIELGEIEAALNQHPQVREAVVRTGATASGQQRLVAYVIPRTAHQFVLDTLRLQLQQTLPDYMIPQAFVLLERFPLTSNGKIDDQALPQPCSSAADTAYQEPQTAAEKALATIWQDLLRADRVGLQDNFFALGGDSILSLLLISRARQAGLYLTPKAIFNNKTLQQLAGVAGTADAQPQADQAPVTGDVPLLPIQQWFFSLESPAPHHFNQAHCFIVPARLDLPALSQALQHLLVHHDMLRAGYRRTTGGWQQTVAEPRADPIAITYLDLSGLSAAARGDCVGREAARLQASMALASPPLMRLAWCDYGPAAEGRLLWVIHHLVVDGVSWRILETDLNLAYQALRHGRPVILSPKSTPFQRWASALADASHAPRLRAQLGYWEALAQQDYQPLPVAADLTRTDNTIASTGHYHCELSAAATRPLLLEIAPVYRTQINDLLLTALVMAFRPYTGIDTLWLDLETHGRHTDGELSAELASMDLSHTVGWFTSMFPLRLQLDQADIGANIKSIKEQLRRIPMQGLGYGLLRYQANQSTLAQMPQPEVGFNYLGQFDEGPDPRLAPDERLILGSDDLDLGPDWSPQQRRHHVLDINGWVSNGCLQFTWSYSRNAHHPEFIKRLSEDYLGALQTLIDHCQSGVEGGLTPSDVPLLHCNQRQLDQLLQQIVASNTDLRPSVEALFPPTPSQQGMLLEAVGGTADGLHLEQQVIPLNGVLDVEALHRAWEYLLDRHATLRSGFVWMEQRQPVQYVLHQVPVPFMAEDWRGADGQAQQDRLAQWLATDRQQGFVLTRAPLLRIRLLRMSEALHQMVLSLHHVLMDGWSLASLRDELLQCYRAEQAGQRPALAPAPAFATYIDWLQQQDLAHAEQFWRDYLRDYNQPVRLRSKQPAAAIPGYGMRCALLDTAGSGRLQALARQLQVTTSTLVQAAWALLLHHYSGQDDIVFGTTVAGRPPDLAGVAQILGLFINTLPVRARIVPDRPLWDWLALLQRDRQAQQPYEYCSAGQIHDWSGIPTTTPLYESILVYENYPTPDEDQTRRGLTLGDTQALGAQTHHPLTLLVTATPDELEVQMIYLQACFAPNDAQHILQDMLRMLAALGHAQAGTTLGQLTTDLGRGNADQWLLLQDRGRPAAAPGLAPRDAVEQELADIWQEVMRRPVGIEDSFFDLGGHSLLAIQLMARIEQVFRRNLPLTQLFRYPTIAKLAAMLKAQTTMTLSEDPVISMGGDGDATPLFLLPGGGSDPLYFHELTRHLAPEQPIFGLRPAGLDGTTRPSRTVEEAAAYAIANIKERQPHGPYQLLGHSSGAHVAFEIAQQLMRQGDEIKLFASLDMPAPLAIRSLMQFPDKDDIQHLLDYAEALQPYTRNPLAISRETLQPLNEGERISRLIAVLESARLLLPDTDHTRFKSVLEVARATAEMIPRYAPGDTRPLTTVLFLVTEQVGGTGSLVIPVFEQDAGWETFGPTRLHRVPGNHFTLVNEPHVEVLAGMLRAYLRDAGETPTKASN